MRIDCDHCAARGRHCGDCVVTVILGAPPVEAGLDEADRRALRVLAEAGLWSPDNPPTVVIEPHISDVMPIAQ